MRTLKILIDACFYTAAMAFISFAGYSQEGKDVESVYMTMSKGNQAGYKVVIPPTTMEEGKAAWISQVRQDFKANVTELNGEIIFNNAIARQFSANPIDIYSIMTPSDSNLSLIAFFVIDQVFFDTAIYQNGPQEEKIFHEICNYLQQFSADRFRHVIEKDLAAGETVLNNLEKQLSAMNKEHLKMNKSASKMENKITDMNEEIKFLENLRSAQMKQIEAKRLAPVPLTDKEAHEKGYAELDQLEKAKAKTEKSLKKMERSKNSAQEKFDDYRKGLDEKLNEQTVLKEQINVQEQKVKQLKARIKALK